LEVNNFAMSSVGGEFTGFTPGGFFFQSSGLSLTRNGSTVASTPSSSTAAGGGSIDTTPLCVGDCAGINVNTNNYNVIPAGGSMPVNPIPGPSTRGSFLLADMFMTDTVISGATPDGEFGAQAGAQLTGDNNGIAQSGTAHLMQWSFSLANADSVNFSWDQTTVLAASISNLNEKAAATLNFNITILDADGAPINDQSFDSSDTLSQSSVSFNGLTAPRTNNGGSGISIIEDGHFLESDLAAGDYVLQITFDSTASVTSVSIPEPGALALFGMGLLGMGMVARRRRNNAVAA
jgi:hypothetical protein